MSRGSPGPGKRAKRVPPVPTPHDGDRHGEVRHLLGDGIDIDAAARELGAEPRIVRLQSRLEFLVLFCDQVLIDRAFGHLYPLSSLASA